MAMDFRKVNAAPEELAERLRLRLKVLLHAMGYTNKGFAYLVGLSRQQIDNYVSGRVMTMPVNTMYGILFVVDQLIENGDFEDNRLVSEILNAMVYDIYYYEDEGQKALYFLELKSLAYTYHYKGITLDEVNDKLTYIFTHEVFGRICIKDEYLYQNC